MKRDQCALSTASVDHVTNPKLFPVLLLLLLVITGCDPAPSTWQIEDEIKTTSLWSAWHRPVDNPVFTAAYDNNHDPIFFYEPEGEYRYYLLVSHDESAAHLWRARDFSIDSGDWELVSSDYQIAGHYEYDDGVKVADTYYLYEAGVVYTYSGSLEDGSGRWLAAGWFPQAQCDDVGVLYEDGVFHMFGEYGDYPHGPDGTSLSHFVSRTGIGDWELVDRLAADANPHGGHRYGVGDPTLIRQGDSYLMFSDIESKDLPYRVAAWRSDSLDSRFSYLGVAISPRSDEIDDWDNDRIQDCDILRVEEVSRLVMACNMRDLDGNPGGSFPSLENRYSRVIGFFFSDATLGDDSAAGEDK